MDEFHSLKINFRCYIDIISGIKTFELCKNDEDYQKGDVICFHVIMEDLTLLHDDDLYQITYILKDVPGLDKDYCILGIKKLVIKE